VEGAVPPVSTSLVKKVSSVTVKHAVGVTDQNLPQTGTVCPDCIGMTDTLSNLSFPVFFMLSFSLSCICNVYALRLVLPLVSYRKDLHALVSL
jgi:hypothetical protein